MGVVCAKISKDKKQKNKLDNRKKELNVPDNIFDDLYDEKAKEIKSSNEYVKLRSNMKLYIDKELKEMEEQKEIQRKLERKNKHFLKHQSMGNIQMQKADNSQEGNGSFLNNNSRLQQQDVVVQENKKQTKKPLKQFQVDLFKQDASLENVLSFCFSGLIREKSCEPDRYQTSLAYQLFNADISDSLSQYKIRRLISLPQAESDIKIFQWSCNDKRRTDKHQIINITYLPEDPEVLKFHEHEYELEKKLSNKLDSMKSQAILKVHIASFHKRKIFLDSSDYILVKIVESFFFSLRDIIVTRQNYQQILEQKQQKEKEIQEAKRKEKELKEKLANPKKKKKKKKKKTKKNQEDEDDLEQEINKDDEAEMEYYTEYELYHILKLITVTLLEAKNKNIFHLNLHDENIVFTDDMQYKIQGFQFYNYDSETKEINCDENNRKRILSKMNERRLMFCSPEILQFYHYWIDGYTQEKVQDREMKKKQYQQLKHEILIADEGLQKIQKQQQLEEIGRQINDEMDFFKADVYSLGVIMINLMTLGKYERDVLLMQEIKHNIEINGYHKYILLIAKYIYYVLLNEDKDLQAQTIYFMYKLKYQMYDVGEYTKLNQMADLLIHKELDKDEEEYEIQLEKILEQKEQIQHNLISRHNLDMSDSENSNNNSQSQSLNNSQNSQSNSQDQEYLPDAYKEYDNLIKTIKKDNPEFIKILELKTEEEQISKYFEILEESFQEQLQFLTKGIKIGQILNDLQRQRFDYYAKINFDKMQYNSKNGKYVRLPRLILNMLDINPQNRPTYQEILEDISFFQNQETHSINSLQIDLDQYKPNELNFLDDDKKPKQISLKYDPEQKISHEEIVQKFQLLFQLGKTYLDLQNYEDALQVFDLIKKSFQHDQVQNNLTDFSLYQVIFLMGVCKMQLRQLDDCQVLFDDIATEIDEAITKGTQPKNYNKIFYYKAYASFLSGEPISARNYLQRLYRDTQDVMKYEDRSSLIQYYQLLGLIYSELGEHTDVINCFQFIISEVKYKAQREQFHTEEEVQAEYYLGLELLKIGEYDDAQFHFKNVLKYIKSRMNQNIHIFKIIKLMVQGYLAEISYFQNNIIHINDYIKQCYAQIQSILRHEGQHLDTILTWLDRFSLLIKSYIQPYEFNTQIIELVEVNIERTLKSNNFKKIQHDSIYRYYVMGKAYFYADNIKKSVKMFIESLKEYKECSAIVQKREELQKKKSNYVQKLMKYKQTQKNLAQEKGVENNDEYIRRIDPVLLSYVYDWLQYIYIQPGIFIRLNLQNSQEAVEKAYECIDNYISHYSKEIEENKESYIKYKFRLGRIYFLHQKYVEAYSEFEDALREIDRMQKATTTFTTKVTYSKIILWQATIQLINNNEQKAYQLINSAQNIFQYFNAAKLLKQDVSNKRSASYNTDKYGPVYFIAKINLEIGLICLSLSNYQKASTYLQQGYKTIYEVKEQNQKNSDLDDKALLKIEKDWQYMKMDYIFMLAYTSILSGDIETAKDNFEDCYNECKILYTADKMKRDLEQRYILIGDYLGRVYLLKGFYKKAHEIFEASLNTFQHSILHRNITKDLIFKLANVANTAYLLGDDKVAYEKIDLIFKQYEKTKQIQEDKKSKKKKQYIVDEEILFFYLKKADICQMYQINAQVQIGIHSLVTFYESYNQLPNPSKQLTAMMCRVSGLYNMEVNLDKDYSAQEENDMSRIERAQFFYQKAFDIYKQLDDVYNVINMNIIFINTFIQIGNFKEARNKAKELLDLKEFKDTKDEFNSRAIINQEQKKSYKIKNQTFLAEILLAYNRTSFHLYQNDKKGLYLTNDFILAKQLLLNAFDESHYKVQLCNLYISCIYPLKNFEFKNKDEDISNELDVIQKNYLKAETPEKALIYLTQAKHTSYRSDMFKNFMFLKYKQQQNSYLNEYYKKIKDQIEKCKYKDQIDEQTLLTLEFFNGIYLYNSQDRLDINLLKIKISCFDHFKSALQAYKNQVSKEAQTKFDSDQAERILIKLYEQRKSQLLNILQKWDRNDKYYQEELRNLQFTEDTLPPIDLSQEEEFDEDSDDDNNNNANNNQFSQANFNDEKGNQGGNQTQRTNTNTIANNKQKIQNHQILQSEKFIRDALSLSERALAILKAWSKSQNSLQNNQQQLSLEQQENEFYEPHIYEKDVRIFINDLTTILDIL